MKKNILLFLTMICFLTIEAQTITKFEGKRNTQREYINLDSGMIRFPSTMAFINLQLDFRFEFTNGNTALEVGDTILIRGHIGNQDFLNGTDTIILQRPLAANDILSVLFSGEAMGYYTNVLQKVNDSIYKGTIYGKIEYISRYVTKDIPTERFTEIVLIQDQQSTPPEPPEPPPFVVTTIDTVVCGEYVYNGVTYHESGAYTHQYNTPAGDSIVVINLTVHEIVGVIGNIQGNTVITQTGTYTYSISPVANASVYHWTISNSQWTFTGTGTQISLNITEAGTGVLSVKATNGLCESKMATLSISFCLPLGTMGEIQGENLITETGKYTYSIAPVENATAYQWTISNTEWNILGSSTSTTVDLYISRSSIGTLSVKAIDDCKKHTQKDFTIQANISVSVREYEENNTVQIYPNPVGDVIHVSIENNTLNNVEIYLFDIFGRLLERQKITDKKTVINMSSFSAGVYFLQIKEDEKIIKSTKVVKVE